MKMIFSCELCVYIHAGPMDKKIVTWLCTLDP